MKNKELYYRDRAYQLVDEGAYEGIKDECDSLLNYFRFVRNATKDKSFDLDNKLDHVIDYIAKLERENLGLKEYKLHQERANERRYRSGEESWHRGSVVAKKK